MRAERRAVPTPASVRRSAAVMALGTAVILYTTLFPFDFVPGGSLRDALAGVSFDVHNAWALEDLPRNVLLFVPFGFGLAGCLTRRVRAPFPTALAVVVAGATLSAAVELAQATVLLRFASAADVIANTVGAAAGWWCFERLGPPLLAGGPALASRLGRTASGWLMLAVGLGPALALLASTAWCRSSTELRTWDPSYHLVLANEQSGDRPWSGALATVEIIDEALSPAEVRRSLSRVESLGDRGWSLRITFGAGSEPPAGFTWQGAGPSPDGAEFGPDHWLASAAPMAELTERIANAGQFTVVVDAATRDTGQTGPARVLSLSADPFRSNLMVGQQGPDLVLRVRTRFTGAAGADPQFVLHDVFADTAMHWIVVVFDGTTLRVAVDTMNSHRSIDLLPAFAPWVRAFPDEVVQVRFSLLGPMVFTVLYRLIAAAPWGLAVGLQQRRQLIRIGTVVTVLVPPLVFEFLVAMMMPQHVVRPGPVALGGGAAIAGYSAGLFLRPRRRQVDESVGLQHQSGLPRRV